MAGERRPYAREFEEQMALPRGCRRRAACGTTACTLFAVNLLFVPSGVLGSGATFEITDPPHYAEPVDFSVGPSHAYVVYRRQDSAYHAMDMRDLALGIYTISDGTQVSNIQLASIWNESPFGSGPLVAMTAHDDGVVVKVTLFDRGTFLAHIDNGGEVTTRGFLDRMHVFGVDRIRGYTLVHTNRRIMLLDDRLQTKFEWAVRESSVHEPMIMSARPNGDNVFVLEVERRKEAKGTGGFSGTLQRLTFEGRFVEKESVAVPMSFDYPARLLVWRSGLLLVIGDGSQWHNCMLANGGEKFHCTVAPWLFDASRAMEGFVARSVHNNVVRSGDGGYVAAVSNGCRVWSRRYDLSGGISRYQPSFAGGNANLGIVHKLILKERADDGELFSLTAGLRTSSGEGGSDHTIFGNVTMSMSSVGDGIPRIGGCRSWGGSGQVTAEGVKACVEKGADPNASGNCGAWMRPLAEAARNSDSKAIRALLKAGADPNAQDEDGDTALHDAARYGKAADKLETLLEGGANPALRNNAGKLAWDYARENDALRGSSVLGRLRLDSDQAVDLP